ncbi:Glycine receptor subunit beta-type [Dirofilaria immitis]
MIISSYVATIHHNSTLSYLSINTTYQAEDVGIRWQKLLQCKAWNLWWKLQHDDIVATNEMIDFSFIRRKQITINHLTQLIKYGLPKYLLSKYKIVHINFENVCKNYSRYLLIDSYTLAKQYGINLYQLCYNYEVKMIISSDMNDDNEYRKYFQSYFSTSTAISQKSDLLEMQRKKPNDKYNQDYDMQYNDKNLWLNNQSNGIRIINPRAEIIYQMDIDYVQNDSMIVIRDQKVADFFKLGDISSILELHKGFKIDLKKACIEKKFDIENEMIRNNDNTDNITRISQNSDDMDSIDKKAKINATNSEEKISALANFFKHGIQISNILNVFDSEILSNLVPLSSSTLMPLLNQSHYDSRSPPTIMDDSITEVFFGILIQSISNFDQSTMDYDMDMWLRMAWRDPRLAHEFDRPILINDENILKKIWRPTPFFKNAKEAKYHRMTKLNFWLYVFPNGEIFFETHIYLKPSCKLILCKYPHDNQVCSLKITATSDQSSIRYSWFPHLNDAIRMNKLMDSEELYIEKFYKRNCDGVRKTGNFSCLQASCQLKRHLRYHMTRTYIPTATCVIFSWISVWLPEEFVTGRIFGALTLFLTLSAESSAVKEMLPKVSYMKAIDLWFGFTTSFVFITMLEALIVISLEYKSRKLRLKAEAGVDDISRYQIMLLMLKSSRYHSTARNIDKYCRTLYPIDTDNIDLTVSKFLYM